ncbi:MAG: 7-carboxy-7-deazaguanine synthase QueE [Methanosphaera sp.]|nr:7-carboxy-7-deazaguanine synthase QueE [Methanosphaera sp.]
MGGFTITANISEIFSSIQGEGKFIGKRQIFIRFAGCNIDCIYCDTLESKSFDAGKPYSYERLNEEIQSLMTDDFHSLEITGGEPLVHAGYIKEFLTKYPYPAMLETNATLPDNLRLLKDVITVVSMDIKLPEHFEDKSQWQDAYSMELESIRIMQEENIDYYLKIVVSDDTPLEVIGQILDDLNEIQGDDILLVVQPVSPMEKWTDKTHLFEISELVGKHYPVSIIPQIHKYMQID